MPKIPKPHSPIAPCGINCRLCLAFQRTKNHCSGCNSPNQKARHCLSCQIKHCLNLPKSGRCNSTCSQFPCARIKHIDKRYRKSYGPSLLDNLKMIEQVGLKAYLQTEQKKWLCTKCGAFWCIHRPMCQTCGSQNPHFPHPNSPPNHAKYNQ